MKTTHFFNKLIVFIGAPTISFIISFYLDSPWWIFTFVSFILSTVFLVKIFLEGFLLNFLGTFLFWLLMSYSIDHLNNSILSTKIAQLFSINSALSLILVISLFGGLLSGISGALGTYLHTLYTKPLRK